MAFGGSVALRAGRERAKSGVRVERELDGDALSGWRLMAAIGIFAVALALFAGPPTIAILILGGWLR